MKPFALPVALLLLATTACVAVPLDATVNNAILVGTPGAPAVEPGAPSPGGQASQAPLDGSPPNQGPSAAPSANPSSLPPSGAPSPQASPSPAASASPANTPSASQPPLNGPAATPTPGPVVGGSSIQITNHPLGVAAVGRSFAFLSAQVGFLSADWGLLRTEDGGRTWQVPGSVPLPAEKQTASDISLSMAPGGQQGCLLSSDAQAFTSDGGRTWVSRSQRFDFEHHPMVIFDSGVLVVGGYGAAQVTRDQGESWEDVVDLPGGGLVHAGSQVVAVEAEGQLYAWDPNSGQLESLANLNPEGEGAPGDNFLVGLAFANGQTGLAVQRNGKIMGTDDGGRSFRQVFQWDAPYRASISWADADHAFVALWTSGNHPPDLHRLTRVDGALRSQALPDNLLPSWTNRIQATGANSFIVSGERSVRRVVLPE